MKKSILTTLSLLVAASAANATDLSILTKQNSSISFKSIDMNAKDKGFSASSLYLQTAAATLNDRQAAEINYHTGDLANSGDSFILTEDMSIDTKTNITIDLKGHLKIGDTNNGSVFATTSMQFLKIDASESNMNKLVKTVGAEFVNEKFAVSGEVGTGNNVKTYTWKLIGVIEKNYTVETSLKVLDFDNENKQAQFKIGIGYNF